MAPQYPWLDALHALVPALDMNAFLDQLQTCSAVSGYDFRATMLITATQVSQTCANPSCTSVENVLLGRAAATESDNGPLLRTVLNHFARPMVEFCWHYRLPGAPCPNIPVHQFERDFAAMQSDCERAVNRSIDDMYIVPAGDSGPASYQACTVPACIGFFKRVRALRYSLCPRSTQHYASAAFEQYCNASWVSYEVLSGPVPEVPTQAPTPLPTNTVPVSEPASTSSSSHSMITLVSTVAAAVVLLALLVFLWRRHRRRHQKKRAETPLTTTRSDFSTMALSTPFNSMTSSQRDILPIECMHIASSQLKQIGLIAAGASGLVYLVQDGNGNQYASKQLVKRQLTEAKIDAFIAEISIAASLKHPQIVEFIGASGISRHHLQAIFEYMEGGDLRRYLDTTPWQPWNHTKLTIALDVAKALAYIHSFTDSEGTATNGIVHRDLKSRNIMLTKELRAKVGDFGVSRTVSTQATMTAGVGTSRWLAPEVIVGNDGAYDAACDVYSFGVVLTELDSHRLPYYDSVTSTGEELPEIVILSRVADGSLRPSLLSSCLDDVAALAMKCLSFDPKERLAASELVEELTRIQRHVD